jgi:hypothetical protein
MMLLNEGDNITGFLDFPHHLVVRTQCFRNWILSCSLVTKCGGGPPGPVIEIIFL